MKALQFPEWPAFSDGEIEAVARVLRSGKVNYWTGEETRSFEHEFAQWVGVDHAIALANGTVALELALRGLEIGPGDEVIVSPRSFIASASCVANVGATPVFADVDRDSGNLCAATIEPKITSRTRAIIVVHLAGWPADLDPILSLAARHGIRVIEDCAQAHGARYKGRSVGSIGDVGAWSFCQDKILTTGGEGGMVTTRDRRVWERMWAYKDHGKSWSAVQRTDHPTGFRWLHESIGSNWRMTEMQAAIGRLQLRLLPEWSARRRRNAAMLRARLQGLADPDGILRLPQFSCGSACDCAQPDHCLHAFYRFGLHVRPDRLRSPWNRDAIIEAIAARGLPCSVGGCGEVYRERAFDSTGWRPNAPLPVARELSETSLALLVHPTIDDGAIDWAGEVVADVLSKASSG